MGEQATSFGVGCWSCGDGDDGGLGAVWAERDAFGGATIRGVRWGRSGRGRGRLRVRACYSLLCLAVPVYSLLFLLFSSFRRNFHGYSVLFLAFPCSSLLFLVFLCLSLLFIVFSLSVLLLLAILSYSLSFLLFSLLLVCLVIPCYSLFFFVILCYSPLFLVIPCYAWMFFGLHCLPLVFLVIPCYSLLFLVFFQNVAGPPPTKARSEEASRMPAAPAQSANEQATGA